MRPRFMNRGSTCSTGANCVTGSGFNEAPIHESGKSGYVESDALAFTASMRPRFMNRGSGVRSPDRKYLAVLQ